MAGGPDIYMRHFKALTEIADLRAQVAALTEERDEMQRVKNEEIAETAAFWQEKVAALTEERDRWRTRSLEQDQHVGRLTERLERAERLYSGMAERCEYEGCHRIDADKEIAQAQERERRLVEALKKHDCPTCRFEVGDGDEWVCRDCRDLRAALAERTT